MRLLRYIWPLAGLMPTLTLGRVNINIWDVDESCTNYHDSTTEYTYGLKGGVDQTSFLEESFELSLKIAEAAQSSLKFVLEKRPDEDTDKDGYNKWVRIADSIAVTLGFYPTPDKAESATEGYWPGVIDPFDKMIKTVQAKENDPPNGYSPAFPGKPMLVCGDNWEWFGADDTVPGLTHTLKERFKAFWEAGAVGAWYKKHRWVFSRKVKNKPVMCRTDTMAAAINWLYDALVVCDLVFKEGYKDVPSPEDIVKANTIKEGDLLDKYATHLSFVFVHELLHWVGGLKKNANGSWNLRERIITDAHAVDSDGKLLYVVDGQEMANVQNIPNDVLGAKGWQRVIAYRVRNIWNLAKTHTGAVAGYTGPKVAIANSDSLAMFALMMYFDKWNWASAGEAKPAGPIYGKN